jgi:uncharacterized protein (UPF0335 family)
MKPDQDLLTKLLHKVARTKQEEFDCQDVYELMDIYAETSALGQDAEAMLPLVKHHLEMCRDCLEEYEALKRILDSQE